MAPERSRSVPSPMPLAIGRIVVALLIVVSAQLAIRIQPGPGYAVSLAVLYAVAATLAFLFVFPQLRATGRQVIAWSATLALLTMTVLILHPETRSQSANLPALVSLVFLVCTFLGTLAMRIEREIIIIGYIALLLTPLWAGPLLELAGNPRWANASVLAMSPLTTFAIALDFDFLRTPWFYDHSAIAAMRYQYPALTVPVLLFGTLPCIVAVRAAGNHFRSRLTSNEVSS